MKAKRVQIMRSIQRGSKDVSRRGAPRFLWAAARAVWIQYRGLLLVVVLYGLLMQACSTHYTTSQRDEGATPIYALDQSQALAIAHQALIESFPGRKVTGLEGPIQGFATSYRILLDTYSQQVVVLPLEGVGPSGEITRGYAFDVSGSGSAILTGTAKNRGLFRRVRDLAEATGTRVLVTNPRPVSTSEGSRSSAGPDEAEASRRLRELKELRRQELISEEQLERKQREILEDL